MPTRSVDFVAGGVVAAFTAGCGMGCTPVRAKPAATSRLSNVTARREPCSWPLQWRVGQQFAGHASRIRAPAGRQIDDHNHLRLSSRRNARKPAVRPA